MFALRWRCFLLHFEEEIVEGLEPPLPKLPVPLRPLGDLPDGRRVKAAHVRAAGDSPPDQPGSLQHPNMLRGRREGHPQGRRQLAEVLLFARELPEDRPARRVGQGVKDAVQVRGSIQNHMV